MGAIYPIRRRVDADLAFPINEDSLQDGNRRSCGSDSASGDACAGSAQDGRFCLQELRGGRNVIFGCEISTAPVGNYQEALCRDPGDDSLVRYVIYPDRFRVLQLGEDPCTDDDGWERPTIVLVRGTGACEEPNPTWVCAQVELRQTQVFFQCEENSYWECRTPCWSQQLVADLLACEASMQKFCDALICRSYEGLGLPQ